MKSYHKSMVRIYVKCRLFLSSFNHNWNVKQIGVNITNIKSHKICSVWAVLSRADRRDRLRNRHDEALSLVSTALWMCLKNKQYFGFNVWKILPTLMAVTVKCSHLRHDAMQYATNLLTFRMNLVPPSLGMLPGQWRQQVPPNISTYLPDYTAYHMNE